MTSLLNGDARAVEKNGASVVKVGKGYSPADAAALANEKSSVRQRRTVQGKKQKDQYVELSQERNDKIFVILAEFGDQRHPDFPDQDTDSTVPGPTTFNGPLRNKIPEPDRTTDNSTIWQQDYDRQHYQDLYFGSGKGKESVKTYYETQSSGRYTVDGQVQDWVKVPYNEARYGPRSRRRSLRTTSTTATTSTATATSTSPAATSTTSNDLANTMTTEVDLTAKTGGVLEAKVRYSIEAGYDYAYVQASADGGSTWTSLDGTIGGAAIEDDASGNAAIDGGQATWAALKVPLGAYDGKKIKLRFLYRTDGGVAESGMFVDDLTVEAGTQTLLTDGAEGGGPSWSYDGFSIVGSTSTELFDNYYIAGHAPTTSASSTPCRTTSSTTRTGTVRWSPTGTPRSRTTTPTSTREQGAT